MEMIDIYDKDRNFTGLTVSRKTKLEEDQYMLYVLALIEDKNHRFLVTRRTADKKWAAMWWEIPGGGARAGETSFQAVCREAKEETGLDISEKDTRLIYTYSNKDCHHRDNYFADIYYCQMDFDLKDVHVQEEEVSDVRLADIEQIRQLKEGDGFLHYERILEALDHIGYQKENRSSYRFGVDVGGLSVKIGLTDKKGDMLQKKVIPTRLEKEGELILSDTAQAIQSMIEENDLQRDQIKGIGLCIPGPVDQNGVVNCCVNLGWKKKTDAAAVLHQLTGMKVKICNDANGAALGEISRLPDFQGESAVFVTLGTGVGGGIIYQGKILAGDHGAAGEIGHIHVEDKEIIPCNCGRYGCLEQYSSATGIIRMGHEKEIELGFRFDREEDELTAKDIFDAAKYEPGQDQEENEAALIKKEAANEILERAFFYLGKALSDICCVIDPRYVIIGGGVSAAGSIVTDLAEKHFKQQCFMGCSNTEFKLARLGNDAGIYGAAACLDND